MSARLPGREGTVHLGLLAVLFAHGLVFMAAGLVSAMLPQMQTRYFQTRTSCAIDDPNGDQCAGKASAASGLVQSFSALGALMLSPVYGAASDKYGRRPFIFTGLVACILPFAALWAKPFDMVPFYALWALQGFCPSPLGSFLTAVADVTPSESRLEIFGAVSAVVMGSFSLGAGISGSLQASLGMDRVLFLAVVLKMFALVVAASLLPETLRPRDPIDLVNDGVAEKSQNEETDQRQSELKMPGTPLRVKSLYNILAEVSHHEKGEKTLRTVAILGLISGLSETGVAAIAMFFVSAQFKFTSAQIGQLLCLVALSGCLWQALGLRFMARLGLSDGLLFQVALASNLLHDIGYYCAWSPWVLYANAFLAGGAMVQPTILRAVVSKALGPERQGHGLGVLGAVDGACRVIAPSIFGIGFNISSSIGMPGLPFLVAAALLAVSSALGSKLLPGKGLEDSQRALLACTDSA